MRTWIELNKIYLRLEQEKMDGVQALWRKNSGRTIITFTNMTPKYKRRLKRVFKYLKFLSETDNTLTYMVA